VSTPTGVRWCVEQVMMECTWRQAVENRGDLQGACGGDWQLWRGAEELMAERTRSQGNREVDKDAVLFDLRIGTVVICVSCNLVGGQN
jgi:hypothetical protein